MMNSFKNMEVDVKAKSRIARHFAAISEGNATEFSRAVDAYGRQKGDAQLGVGAKPQEIAGYLKHKITGGFLYVDDALTSLIQLANDEESAVLREDPAICRALDEYQTYLESETQP